MPSAISTEGSTCQPQQNMEFVPQMDSRPSSRQEAGASTPVDWAQTDSVLSLLGCPRRRSRTRSDPGARLARGSSAYSILAAFGKRCTVHPLDSMQYDTPTPMRPVRIMMPAVHPVSQMHQRLRKMGNTQAAADSFIANCGQPMAFAVFHDSVEVANMVAMLSMLVLGTSGIPWPWLGLFYKICLTLKVISSFLFLAIVKVYGPDYAKAAPLLWTLHLACLEVPLICIFALLPAASREEYIPFQRRLVFLLCFGVMVWCAIGCGAVLPVACVMNAFIEGHTEAVHEFFHEACMPVEHQATSCAVINRSCPAQPCALCAGISAAFPWEKQLRAGTLLPVLWSVTGAPDTIQAQTTIEITSSPCGTLV